MNAKRQHLPFRYLEPAFFGGLLDDPLLFLRIRPLRRALLFDCGQIAHLAKRVVKAIDTVFISHAHMDHIMGIPTLVRHHHASPRPLDIFGPPGIADRIEHHLKGYDWNLCEPTWFTIHVHEVHRERLCHVRFSGPHCFARQDAGDTPRQGREIWSCRYVSVAAELFDHKLPVLGFRIQERPCFTVDPQLLAAQGLCPGGWLRDLKSRIWKGQTDKPVLVDGKPLADPERLYASIAGESAASAIGYLTDVGWTEANLAAMEEFLAGVTLLCAECTFLRADLDKARASHHLCSDDLNRLVQRLSPRYLLPMHLSKSYLRQTADIYGELAGSGTTTILRLPDHIVPPPLGVEEVARWLRVSGVAEEGD